MTTLYVSDIKFMSRADAQINGSRDISKLYNFLITSAVPDLPPASYKHKITDLSTLAERYIVFHMSEEMSRTSKKLLVIDLSNYPYVTSYFDYRDQAKQFAGDTTQFAKDVINAWDKQDEGPTIVINTNIPHTGLKFSGLSAKVSKF